MAVPMQSSFPPGLSVDNTMGTLLIGLLVSAALFGGFSFQAIYYYDNYKSDSAWMKLLVSVPQTRS